MKKLFLTLAVVLSGYCSYAQTWSGATPGNIFYNSGKVGIGTTSLPSNGALQVSGPVDNISVNANGVFRIYDGTNFAGGIGSDAWAGAGNNLDFAVYASNNMNIYGGGQKRISILSSGNVGIGTTSPVARLHVAGVAVLAGSAANIDPHGPAVDPNTLANTGQMLIGWNREGGPGETDFIGNQGAGSAGGFAFYNHDNSNNETQLMWIQGNGNVAIGTKDPKGYKLAVNGSAIATSMTVKFNSSWPDFVFKKEYQLPSLTEVKTYIDQNHHLPDMPSEQEVLKDGINLGEMNKMLTKKVEELTLYLIEKDKKDADQQTQINSQIEQLKTQRAEIDELKGQVKALLEKSK